MTHGDVTEMARLLEEAAKDADFDGLGIRVTRVEMLELADGSGRPAALVTILDENEEEATLRIALAAAGSAPGWAFARHGRTEVEWLEEVA